MLIIIERERDRERVSDIVPISIVRLSGQQVPYENLAETQKDTKVLID